MTSRISHSGLQIDKVLYDFVNNQALPNTGLSLDLFWSSFSQIIKILTPINKALLAKRDELQQQVDVYHKENPVWNTQKYQKFLFEIGYLVPEIKDFKIETQNVDEEIAKLAGPQLVVPVNNARFALNAANARWGSLFDALYGTDVISEADGAEKTKTYNEVRGFKVVQYAKNFLDKALPLSSGSHHDSENYAIVDGQLIVRLQGNLQVTLADNKQLIGYSGQIQNPTNILFKNNGLHIDLQIDSQSQIGRSDKAGIKDIILESALTTIMDCEDSVRFSCSGRW